MLDLLIKGGTVVTPHATGLFDIGVREGTIVAVSVRGGLTEDAQRIIDATGRVVVPGGIDPHTHVAWPVMHEKDGEPVLSAGPEQVSRAALFGGTTTLVDFSVWQEGETIQQAIERNLDHWSGNSYCDYSYHTMLLGDIPSDVVAQIPEAVSAGYPSVKIFTTDITPSRRGRKIRFGKIWEIFQTLARSGGIAAIHAEDDDVVMYNYDKLASEQRVDFKYMAEVHNSMSEDLAFRRVIRLAEHVEGAALYMMHVSASSGVAAINESRAKGYPIYGETLHQYALFTQEDYNRPDGQIYHTYPSLKTENDRLSLWHGMRTGSIHTVGTDELCTPLEVKVQGKRIDDTTGGNSGVEPRMGVMYSEAVARQGYPLARFVDLTSANAAKLLGMYPRKGAVAPGSDADLAILDTGLDYALSAYDLHETDYSPWEGSRIAGWPVMTILRGKVVVDKGTHHGDPRDGKAVPGKVSQDVFDGRC